MTYSPPTWFDRANSSPKIKASDLNRIEQGIAELSVLTPTAVKTTTYTAAVGDLIPADATSAGFTITLPSAPADKSRIAVKKIDSSTNVVSVAAGGSAVFNKAAGSTTLTLPLQNQALVLQYKATGAIWYVVSTDVPLAGLDARFQPLDSDLTTIAGLTATADNVIQSVGGSWASRTMAQLRTALALVKGDVGLGSVDNTADVSKPVSTAQQTALNLKADLASPTFTGTPTLPTPIINGTPTGTGVATAATASALGLRDGNGNMFADNFIGSGTSTVGGSGGGTTTLDVNSTFAQFFTGSTGHIVLLPTTSIGIGHGQLIAAVGTGSIALRSSDNTGFGSVQSGTACWVVANVATPTTPSHWTLIFTSNFAPRATASVTSMAQRDANANLLVNAVIVNGASTVSAAGTTPMVVGSAKKQVLTGSTTHTHTLGTTSVVAYQDWEFINLSSGVWTINSSAGNLVKSLAAGASTVVTALQATPTTAVHWNAS